MRKLLHSGRHLPGVQWPCAGPAFGKGTNLSRLLVAQIAQDALRLDQQAVYGGLPGCIPQAYLYGRRDPHIGIIRVGANLGIDECVPTDPGTYRAGKKAIFPIQSAVAYNKASLYILRLFQVEKSNNMLVCG